MSLEDDMKLVQSLGRVKVSQYPDRHDPDVMWTKLEVKHGLSSSALPRSRKTRNGVEGAFEAFADVVRAKQRRSAKREVRMELINLSSRLTDLQADVRVLRNKLEELEG